MSPVLLYKKKTPPDTPPAPRPLTAAEQERFAFLLANHQITLAPWYVLAELAGILVDSLSPTVREVLDILETRLIRGRGWHWNDRLKNVRTGLNLSPTKLARGKDCPGPRTYQRDIKLLIEIGLIVKVGKASDQSGIYRPTWWLTSSAEEAIAVWQTAASIFDHKRSNRPRGRDSDAPVSAPRRAGVAPDSTTAQTETPYSSNHLRGTSGADSNGRTTGDEYARSKKRALKGVSSLSSLRRMHQTRSSRTSRRRSR